MFGFKLVKESSLSAIREEMSLQKRTLEDIGWINLTTDNFISNELIAGGFQQMLKRSKIYYYNNPLAKHWVQLTTAFIFGEGLSTPKSKEESIQEVINKFWDDPDNRKCFTGYQSQQSNANKLQYEGNLFFIIFTDELGDGRVRVLNTLEIMDIVYDKDDRNRVLFYKINTMAREYSYSSDTYNISSGKIIYVPDIDNETPEEYGVPSDKLRTDAVILHIKMNVDINDKFGVPDLYAGMDWIKAHKDMAGDVATLVKALSKFAWTRKIKGTAANVSSIAANMRSRTNLTNISTMSGQTNVENEASTLEPIDIKSGGVDIGEKGMRQMKLMVCAGAGISEQYFGDPSTGNLATAQMMELPLLKKFTIYQTIWKGIYLTILNYIIRKKVSIGLLDGTMEYKPKTKRFELITSLNTTIDLDFPPILEQDLKSAAEACTTAKNSGLISDELASRLFMMAANVDNIDEEIDQAMADSETKKKEDGPPFDGGDGAPPVKEGIDVPKKPDTRLSKKNNYLTQKMNGYRKVLAGTFDSMRRAVKEGIKVSKDGEFHKVKVQGLDKIVENFSVGMQSAAKSYFPLAVKIGEKYIQSHMRDKKIKVEESLYEAQGLANKVLKNRLAWNEKYINDSFAPYILKSMLDIADSNFDSEETAIEAVNNQVNAYASRVEQYVGALWTVEEMAVKEAGKGTDIQVNFAGEEDEENCEGCAAAINGNPWPIEEAPIPGEQNCLGRCRHALQIIE